MGRASINGTSGALWNHLADFLKVRPYTGSLVRDLPFLLVVCALHYTIVPSLVGRYLLIDLLTPWLVVTFIAAPTGKGALIALIGAFLMETRTSAPAGMYLTCFWMIGTGIYVSRSSLSWRHSFPWVVTFVVAELWMILAEIFVSHVMLGHWHLTLQEVLIQCARLVFSVGWGMILCKRFRTCELPLETP